MGETLANDVRPVVRADMARDLVLTSRTSKERECTTCEAGTTGEISGSSASIYSRVSDDR